MTDRSFKTAMSRFSWAWFSGLALVLLACYALSGCAQMGVGEADTFGKKIAAAYKTTETIAVEVRALRRQGNISQADAAEIISKNTQAIDALDLASVVSATDLTDANTRLVATLKILTQLQAALAAKKVAP